MSRLTPLEQESQDLLVALMDHLTQTQPTARTSYMELMGRMRDLARKLQNKEYGCTTGRHAGICSCAKDGDNGHSLPAR